MVQRMLLPRKFQAAKTQVVQIGSFIIAGILQLLMLILMMVMIMNDE
jgi:hypothetical protein